MAAALTLAACSGPESAPETTSTWEDAKLPEWAKDANIYEVNIRQYTPEGTLNALKEHLPRLAEMNVDILWFMPIQPIGERNRKGDSAAIIHQDYTAVTQLLEPLKILKPSWTRHTLGMHVLLDWVANHSAWDHPWVETTMIFTRAMRTAAILWKLSETTAAKRVGLTWPI